MAQRYKLANPNISSISVDGIEHKVDPETGELVVEMMTPHLNADLEHHGAVLVPERRAAPPPGMIAAVLTEEEKAERDALFLELDSMTGGRVDRRRSLPQLRQMKADLIAQRDREAAAQQTGAKTA